MKFSRFFSNIQETGWYRQFLNPVIDEINSNTKLLDIGTGPGKLIEILSSEKNVKCTGIDTSADMLEEAENKLMHTDAELFKIEPNNDLPFRPESFEYVTICNVLFNLSREAVDQLLDELLRVLKENGKIIVLTPTGKGNFLKLSREHFTPKNTSIYVWYFATKKSAAIWTNKQYLKEYSKKNKLKYEKKIVFKGYAQVEILIK